MQNMVLGQLKHYRYGKLSFIESKLEIGVEMASPLIRQTLDFAKIINSKVKYQFQDCSPGASCAVITATKDADFILLVTEPTPFGLANLQDSVETCRRMEIPCGVIVNRAGAGDTGVEEYCAAEGLPLLLSIPQERRIAEAYSRGEALVRSFPEWAKPLQQVYEEIDQLVVA